MIVWVHFSLQISGVTVCLVASVLCWVQEKSMIFSLFSFFFLVVKMGAMTSKLFGCWSWNWKSRTVFQQRVLEQLDIYVKQKRIWSIPCINLKNQLKMDHRSQYKTYKASRKKHGRKSLWFQVRQSFLRNDTKSMNYKEKSDTFDFIKIKNFCSP